MAVQKFIADDTAGGQGGDSLLKLYKEFILKFDARINQLHCVQVLASIGRKQSDPSVVAELFTAGKHRLLVHRYYGQLPGAYNVS